MARHNAPPSARVSGHPVIPNGTEARTDGGGGDHVKTLAIPTEICDSDPVREIRGGVAQLVEQRSFKP
jgi:hypothetical protein